METSRNTLHGKETRQAGCERNSRKAQVPYHAESTLSQCSAVQGERETPSCMSDCHCAISGPGYAFSE